jgi:bifunctional DNA-binding transcriptional regulator/antitoxin component of YhaV-PrlF toxin-antitoxin module
MQGEQQVYHLKVDASGRIVLATEARQRDHIAEGDTVIITEDTHGLHIKTRDKVLSDAQAYFARQAPASAPPSTTPKSSKRPSSVAAKVSR